MNYERLVQFLTEKRCAYCNADLSEKRRVVLNLKDLRIYCDENHEVMGESLSKGLTVAR